MHIAYITLFNKLLSTCPNQ